MECWDKNKPTAVTLWCAIEKGRRVALAPLLYEPHTILGFVVWCQIRSIYRTQNCIGVLKSREAERNGASAILILKLLLLYARCTAVPSAFNKTKLQLHRMLCTLSCSRSQCRRCSGMHPVREHISTKRRVLDIEEYRLGEGSRHWGLALHSKWRRALYTCSTQSTSRHFTPVNAKCFAVPIVWAAVCSFACN